MHFDYQIESQIASPESMPFEYLQKNPLDWPALHYALYSHQIDLAKLALTLFPEEGTAVAHSSQGDWEIPEELRDWNCWVGWTSEWPHHDDRQRISLKAWEVAALNGYEDFAIELLERFVIDAYRPDQWQNPWLNRPYDHPELFERLYCIALHSGQYKLVNYLLEHKYPLQISANESLNIPGPFWSLIAPPEIMRVFLFHHLIRQPGYKEIQRPEDVPEKLVAMATHYATGNEPPLRSAFSAGNLDEFLYMTKMGLETLGQRGWDDPMGSHPDAIELFKAALCDPDSRYVLALCNWNGARAKMNAAIDRNHLEAVKALYPNAPLRKTTNLLPFYDRGQREIVYFLLEQGVGRHNEALLKRAIAANDQEMVNYLRSIR